MPVGVRRFLTGHVVQTMAQAQFDSQLENGKLLRKAENTGFDLLVTADQNIAYQQNLKSRRLALVVLGANRWSIVRGFADEIRSHVDMATPGSYSFIPMPSSPPRKS